MRVFLLRLTKDLATQLTNKEYRVANKEVYFRNSSVGDYVFVITNQDRLNGKQSINKLWKVTDIDRTPNNMKMKFSEIKFNEILMENFVLLEIFKINSALAVFQRRQGNGLHEYEIEDMNRFLTLFADTNSINDYLGKTSSYRKIVYVDSKSKVNKTSKDLQFYKDGDVVKYADSTCWTDEFKDKFNERGIIDGNPSLRNNGDVFDNDYGSTYQYFEDVTKGKPTLIGIWDVFCSSNIDSKRFWLFIYNPDEICDADKCIGDHGSIDWHTDLKNGSHYKLKDGDTVYLYSSGSLKAVKYKMVVEKAMLDPKEFADEIEYWVDKERAKNSIFRARFKLVSCLSTPVSLEELTKIGFKKGWTMGSTKLDNSQKFVRALETYFENDGSLSVLTPQSVTPVDENGVFVIKYGIPGCGKSFELDQDLISNGFKADESDNNYVVRTVFYPDYTNGDFIGQYVPQKVGSDLKFEIKPGPFLKALKLAKEHPEHKVALVIEEINRGNAAAIFGDIFQLLDRDVKSGESKYGISNLIISEYLLETLKEKVDEVKIPKNLSIFATMNTSDQNVYKLDAAFKRRWVMQRIINDETKAKSNDFEIPNMSVTWLQFVNRINKQIADNGAEEDRQLGYWFMNSMVETIDADTFANKVLEYLWNDVDKYEKTLFNPSIKTFDELVKEYKDGKPIFNFTF